MTVIEALILGLIQGLSEFLPISSSGHIELAKFLLDVEVKEDLTFTVVVHGATVLSTIVVFKNDIADLLKGGLKFKWNRETRYISMLVFSMIPVVFVGLFFKEDIEDFFFGNILLVGIMLIITATLLTFASFYGSGKKEVNFLSALIIGIAQTFAIPPGISRSGATISTALLLNIKKESAAKFSFLMVLLPILGANAKELLDGEFTNSSTGALPLIIGFFAAFISGWLACTWMLAIVKNGKLLYFAIYCLLVGILAITIPLFI